MQYLRLLILCLSIFGYILFLKKRFRVAIAVAPAMTVLFILSAVYLGGILGVLQWATLLLLLLGLGLFAWMLFQKTPTKWKSILTNPALIFLTVSGVYLFFRFHNRILYSYDDFSHWGLVVKSMLLNNAFPTSENAFLTFQSYPPGSACWIYFVARAVGATEGIYLFAHAMLSLACFSTLFVFFGKRRWFDLFLPVVGAVLLYTNVLDPNCLGVDALLAATGLAAVMTIYRYRTNLASYALLIAPMICAPILVKNSGVFFALVAMALGLYYLFENKATPRRSKITAALILVLIPLVVLLVWRWHVSAAFDDGFSTKHAVSLANFLGTWESNRTSAGEMLQLILLWMINPMKNGTIFALGGFIALAILEALLRRDKKTNQTNLLLILVLVLGTLLYEIGIACMYLFSMNASEFFYQNGADYIRYNSTMVGFLCGLLIAFGGSKLASENEPRAVSFPWVIRLGTLAFLLICLFPRTEIATLAPTYRTDLETRVEQLSLALEETPVPNGGSYLVTAPESEGELSYFMFRYKFNSSDITVSSDAIDSDEVGEALYDYTAYINWTKLAIYTEESYNN